MQALRRYFVAAAACAALAAQAQTKWDLPAAYPATNFHTVNLHAVRRRRRQGHRRQAEDHRARRTRRCSRRRRSSARCRAGRRRSARCCWSTSRTNGRSSAPTACPSWPTATTRPTKLWKAQKPMMDKKLGRAGHDGAVRRAVAAAGHLLEEADGQRRRPEGHQVARLQPGHRRIAELVGAQPVTVQAAEVSQALATGVVESCMSSGSTGADTKLYEHVKYWYDTQAWLPKNAVLVNKAAFDALDAADQAGAAEGRRRRRDARLGGQQEGQHRVAGQAQGRRHADPAAERRSSRPT